MRSPFAFEVRVGFVRVVEVGVLAILITLIVIVLIGLFSPFPLFSVSHAGIRTYSMFGLFGSELTPWSAVTQINIELKGGPRALTIYSQFKLARNRLTRWLIRKAKAPGRVRVSVMRGMTNRPFDAIVDQVLERYEHEIDANGIQVRVSGDDDE